MRNYVCGFIFDKSLENVLLMKKNRPDWQEGYLNGIGGKIESTIDIDGRAALDVPEFPLDAMIRECNEETSLNVLNWNEFCTLSGDGFRVHFFHAIDDGILSAEARTDEELRVCNLKYLLPFNAHAATLPNVRWLIQMALSHIEGNDVATRFEIKEIYDS